jgi:hypothetical protein
VKASKEKRFAAQVEQFAGPSQLRKDFFMKIDFAQELKQLDGQILKAVPGPDNKGGQEAVTLKTVCTNALMATYEDERNLSGEEKLKRFDLASAIYAATEPLELVSEMVVLIKKLLAKAYGPLIVGQAWKMLEGQT